MSDHNHPTIPIPPAPGPTGLVDMATFGRLMGAAADGCEPCQETLTGEMVAGDHRAIAHAGALAWLLERGATQAIAGVERPVDSLPEEMQGIGAAVNTADPARIEAAGGVLNDEGKRAVLNYALDTMVGILTGA